LEAAYFDTVTARVKFTKKIGKFGEGFWITPKGTALYHARMGLRYKDADAATHYMADYLKMGGTLRGLEQSIQNMHPLAGLSAVEQAAFVRSLTEDEKRKLVKAMKFFGELLTAKIEPSER